MTCFDLRRTPLSRRLYLALLALIALGVAACGSGSSGDTIKVGTLESVTGPPAVVGDKMRDGATLAIEQINKSGGVNGKKIESVFYDPAGDTAKAVSQTRRLISRDRVAAVAGGGSQSGIALAMGQALEQAKIPFVATEGAREIVEPAKDHATTFKATFNDTTVVQRTISWWREHGIKRVALLADTSGFGQSAQSALKEAAPKAGIKLDVETFDPGATDLTPQLTRLSKSDPQAYLCWTTDPAGVTFLRNARQLGLQRKAKIMESFGFVDERYMRQAGAAAEGVVLTSPKLPIYDQLPASDPSKATIARFVRDYRARYHEDPNVFAGEAYDSVELLARAMRTAKSTDSSKVTKALASTDGYKGVTGVFKMSDTDHAGLAPSDAVMIEWNGSRFVTAR